MTREQLAEVLGFLPSDEQWAAICAPLAGPRLVLAGAGSGKTAVMSARVVWLVATGAVGRDQVLGLTFTNKAAGELAARIRLLLSRLPAEGAAETGEPVIRTYHAFAADLLSEWGLLAGAEPSSALLTPTDLAVRTYRASARSRVACEELGTSVIRTVSDRVGALDDELCEHLVSPAMLRDHDERLLRALAAEPGAPARTVREAVRRRILLSRVVEEVRADRRADAVVSFADLMRLAVAVSEVPHARQQLRKRFAVVLVDEYQDTSVAQRVMLQNLFGDGHPLTAVGDPLQAIYGWRGASVANIDGFSTDFADERGEAPTLALSINRRSGSLILNVANAVAEPVRSQHPGVRVLEPGTRATGMVTAALHDSWTDEVRWLVRQVREQIDAGRPADQIAVLCRTNDFVGLVADELRSDGIPTAAASLGSVLHLPEVVEVLSTMKVLEKADNGALVRLLTGPQWRIGPADLALLGGRARQLVGDALPADGGDLPDLLAQAVAQSDPVDVLSLMEAVYDPGPRVSAEARRRLRDFTAQLDAMRPALAAGVEEAAHRIVEVSGLSVEVRLGPNATSRLDGLAALFDVIGAYRGAHDDPSVAAFLRWLDFAEHLDETPAADFPVRGQAVRVMTVHRAKGLEWECVLVPALCAGVFPSAQGRDLWTRHYKNLPYPLRGDRARLPVLPGWGARGGSFAGGFSQAEKQLKAQYRQQDELEENRLAYVALTRARDVLFVSGHHWSPKGVLKEPSPYLLTARQVAGVTAGPWVEAQSEVAPVAPVGDVDWPGRDEVFVSVQPPADAGSELTAAELARLARLDADIEAVATREFDQSRPVTAAELPQVLSASMLLRAAQNPAALARDLVRPMPRVTPLAAARGTAFHEWVAQSQQQLSLIPDWDAAIDADRVVDDELPGLIAGYRATPYARMVPVATETAVTVVVGGLVVRGVIDAVYQHPDGVWEVVDWKTNREQGADPLQLALYRLGWAQRVGVAARDVRTAFVYVRDGQVVRPPMPDDDELESLLVAAQTQKDADTAQ